MVFFGQTRRQAGGRAHHAAADVLAVVLAEFHRVTVVVAIVVTFGATGVIAIAVTANFLAAVLAVVAVLMRGRHRRRVRHGRIRGHPGEHGLRLDLYVLLAGGCSDAGTCGCTRSRADGSAFSAAGDGADDGARGSTAANLAHVALGVGFTLKRERLNGKAVSTR